ncbi:MAG: hypothetical protein OEY37_06550 [Gammaproteobacteria bacterium]|nr:hypothetical protein [Gammaproteobacteria bacterium]MDH5617419.1 hypothetical protein [Gammaproteobacteria bacterium]
MSSEKTTIGNAGNGSKSPPAPAAFGHDVAVGAKRPQPELLKLEIDENDDFGGDPYNRTGSHCILKIDEGS